jgi:hypothetical protein
LTTRSPSSGLREAFDAIQSLVGRDVAGLGSISELGAAQEALDYAILVRALLLLRPLMDDGALETIVEAAAAAGLQLQAAQQLARLDALPTEDRDRVIDEVRCYLELHPEVTLNAGDTCGRW